MQNGNFSKRLALKAYVLRYFCAFKQIHIIWLRLFSGCFASCISR